MRIDKYLSQSLLKSRTDVKKDIKSGHIKINDRTIKSPGEHVSENDVVTVCGKVIKYTPFVYLMMNKPAGVVSATTDKYQKTVLDLLPAEYKKADVFPVGRLDIDTEGLLLLTNDGQAAHRLLSPNKLVKKTYYVETSQRITQADKEAFLEGVDLGDFTTAAAHLEILSENTAHLTITEGKFHQVKRMFHSRQNEVVYLKRIRFAHLTLDGNLSPGNFRVLSDEELELL